MFVSADTMALLMASGVPAEKLVEIIRSIERDVEAARPVRSSGAERQARYRQRQAESVTCDVTRDVTGDATASLSPSPPPRTPPPRPHTHGDIYTPRVRAGSDDQQFAAFWAAYPRHVGKDAARKALSKALGRITEDDPLAVILAGIERALPGWGDPEFIPHPATWLNAGRWTDEAPAPKSPRTHERPDRLAAKQQNLERSWSGADRAVEVLAARRAF